MNVTQVTNELKKIELLKDLVLHEPNPENQYGYIRVEPKHFLDKDKNEIKLDGTYSLFVAHMYKDRITYSHMEEFFYLIFSHRGTQRDYRRHKHNTYQIEYNKIFASGKTVDEIVSNFKEKLINYSLK
jgi:hypothetical protein